MMLTVSTTDKRDGKALALFARCAEWQTGHTKDGRPFFAIPGSEAGLFHMADQNDCSCPDRQRSRNVCKHMRAARLWMAAFKTGAVTPKPRPGATCEDDRIVLTPEGAAFLAEQAAADMPRPTYDALYSACPCGDVADGRDGLCDRCASNREHEQRMDARWAEGAEIARQQIAAGLTFAQIINPLAE